MAAKGEFSACAALPDRNNDASSSNPARAVLDPDIFVSILCGFHPGFVDPTRGATIGFG
jgi:hypothetical protein